MTASRIIRRHVARKSHPCAAGRDTIAPGEVYVYEAVPPWTPTRDDPEGPTHPLGVWVTARYHSRCLDYPPPFL